LAAQVKKPYFVKKRKVIDSIYGKTVTKTNIFEKLLHKYKVHSPVPILLHN